MPATHKLSALIREGLHHVTESHEHYYRQEWSTSKPDACAIGAAWEALTGYSRADDPGPYPDLYRLYEDLAAAIGVGPDDGVPPSLARYADDDDLSNYAPNHKLLDAVSFAHCGNISAATIADWLEAEGL